MGDLGDIGSAFVTVELDFAAALRQLREQRPDLNVTVDVDQAQADRAVESALAKTDGTAEAKIDFDDSQTTRAMRDALRLASAKNKAEAKVTGRKLGESSGGGFIGGFFTKIKGFNFGGKLLGLIKPVALISALGLVAEALSAAAAGAVALVAALAPLSGALVALPAILGAVKQGMLVAKLATDGVAGALGGLHDQINQTEFKKLTAPAQQFVRVLDGLKPRVIALQKALQNAAFPGFTSALQRLVPVLQTLQPGLVDTASVLGGLADEASRVAAAMGGDFARIIALNNQTLRNLGLAGIQLSRVPEGSCCSPSASPE